jgi:hypothetical protein
MAKEDQHHVGITPLSSDVQGSISLAIYRIYTEFGVVDEGQCSCCLRGLGGNMNWGVPTGIFQVGVNGVAPKEGLHHVVCQNFYPCR